MQYTVGILSCKRPDNQNTIGLSIDSIANAGFDTMHVFYDVNKRLGSFYNYKRALEFLVIKFPNSDAYIIAEDDILCSKELRNYLDYSLWPENTAYCSCFTPQAYKSDKSGWNKINLGIYSYMAQFYVFPNKIVKKVLNDLDDTDLIRQLLDNSGIDYRNSMDCVLGGWAKLNQFDVYYHTPSLIEHIGDGISTLGNNEHEFCRTSEDFIGENTNALSYFNIKTISVIEIYTNSNCEKGCYSCDKLPLRKEFSNYQFTSQMAEKFVQHIKAHRIFVQRVILAGGEPLLSKHLKEFLPILSASNNIGTIQLSTGLIKNTLELKNLIPFIKEYADIIMVSDYGSNIESLDETISNVEFDIVDKQFHVMQPQTLNENTLPGTCECDFFWLFDEKLYPCPMYLPISLRFKLPLKFEMEMSSFFSNYPNFDYQHGEMKVCSGCYLNTRVGKKMSKHKAYKVV